MHRSRCWPFALALLLGGCAAKQVVPLDCVPKEVEVYVDGALLDRDDVLTLSKDEPHKLFFKRPGHEPQLVVLESMSGPDGQLQLDTDDVCVTLVPVGVGRELTIEAEPGHDTDPQESRR